MADQNSKPRLTRNTITIRNGRRIDIATGADLGPVIPDTANTDSTNFGGNRRRLSRKYKKSKRVFRKKSRSTRRR
jgi:hypothetical protein